MPFTSENLVSRRWPFLLTVTLTMVSAVPAAAQESRNELPAAGTREALIEALARVPVTPGTLAAAVTYVDYRAVEASRPGAAKPASVAELLALQDADAPSANAWFAAARGIASGPADLLLDLLGEGASWPESVGFDFFDIDRAVAFGAPPSDGDVLVGEFRSESIAVAHEARGYSGTPVGDRTLWCSEAGCDAGLEVNLAQRDPSVPFGGRLGRQEPLAVSTHDVLSSADLATLEDMLAAADGEAPSLADQAAYRGLAFAAADDVPILQATLLPGGTLPTLPDLIGLMSMSPEEAADLLDEQAELLGAMAAPDVIAIIDGATGSEQVVTIALAFADEGDATRAAEVVARRLRTARSLTRDLPLSDLLDERGVSAIESRVRQASGETLATGVIELRAPLATDAPDPGTGTLAPSSALYRLLIDLVLTRDVAWLAPAPE